MDLFGRHVCGCHQLETMSVKSLALGQLPNTIIRICHVFLALHFLNNSGVSRFHRGEERCYRIRVEFFFFIFRKLKLLNFGLKVLKHEVEVFAIIKRRACYDILGRCDDMIIDKFWRHNAFLGTFAGVFEDFCQIRLYPFQAFHIIFCVFNIIDGMLINQKCWNTRMRTEHLAKGIAMVPPFCAIK